VNNLDRVEFLRVWRYVRTYVAAILAVDELFRKAEWWSYLPWNSMNNVCVGAMYLHTWRNSTISNLFTH